DGDAARLARERDPSSRGAGGAPVDLAPRRRLLPPDARAGRRRRAPRHRRALAGDRARRPGRVSARLPLRERGAARALYGPAAARPAHDARARPAPSSGRVGPGSAARLTPPAASATLSFWRT